MADDKVTLYNQALSSIGAKSKVSLPTEASKEAEECELWYPTIRDQVLRAAPWPSATTSRRLALAAERDADEDWVSADPAPGWRYAYGLPSDMIWPQHMSDFSPFEMAIRNGNTQALMSNGEQAILTYTSRLTQINLWDSALRYAILHGLAAAICVKLTGKLQLAQLTEQKANDIIISARVQAGNSESVQYESVPDWFTARGFGLRQPTKFVYPVGNLLQNIGGVGVR